MCPRATWRAIWTGPPPLVDALPHVKMLQMLTPHSSCLSTIDELYENGANIKDDQAKKGNKRGRITFATSGTDTRSTQVLSAFPPRIHNLSNFSQPATYHHAYLVGLPYQVVTEDVACLRETANPAQRFAHSRPWARMQVFVNLADNTFLDDQGFTPFGELASESDISLFENKINAEYGEKANQNKIISEGNMLYLQKAFPHMSYIKTQSVEIVAA